MILLRFFHRNIGLTAFKSRKALAPLLSGALMRRRAPLFPGEKIDPPNTENRGDKFAGNLFKISLHFLDCSWVFPQKWLQTEWIPAAEEVSNAGRWPDKQFQQESWRSQKRRRKDEIEVHDDY
ncbi:MAG: hypothetical protein WAK31_25465 [Chthoniobacterales bacterium]